MKRFFASVLFLVMILSSATVWGFGYPSSIADVVPQYPGSEIFPAMAFMGVGTGDNAEHALLMTADSPQQGYEFYKKALEDKGWAIIYADGKSPKKEVDGMKGTQVLHVDSQIVGDQTHIRIILVTGAEPKGDKDDPANYTWDHTIENDLFYQTGIHPGSETYGVNRDFFDMIIERPEKLTRLGFVEFPYRENVQMIYLGDNKWQLTKSGTDIMPILVYGGGLWTSDGDASPMETASAQDQQDMPEQVQTPPAANNPIADATVDSLSDIMDIRPGDTVLNTTNTGQMTMVDFSTTASWEEVMTYYKDQMTGKGWTKLAEVVQGDEGMVQFMKDNEILIVAAPSSGEYSIMRQLQ